MSDIDVLGDVSTTCRCSTIRHCDVTPLMAACNSGDTELLDYLIGKGANVHKESPTWGPPIVFACSCVSASVSVLEWLVSNGAKVDGSVDQFGRTPLMLACMQESSSSVVEYLLDQGADGNKKSFEGYTALHMAAASGRVDLVELLISRGTKPLFKLCTSDPLSLDYVPCPLYLAAVHDQESVIKYLASLPQCPPLCQVGAEFIRVVSHFCIPSVSFLESDLHKLKFIKGICDVVLLMKEKCKFDVQEDSGHGNAYEEISLRALISAADATKSYFTPEPALYLEVFWMAEQHLGSLFYSPTEFKTNFPSWLARFSLNVISVSSLEKAGQERYEMLFQRGSQACIIKEHLLYKYINNRTTHLVLPMLLAIKRLIELYVEHTNYVPNYSFYLKFSFQIFQTCLKYPQTITAEKFNILLHQIVRYSFYFFVSWIATSVPLSADASHMQHINDLGEEMLHIFSNDHITGSTVLHYVCGWDGQFALKSATKRSNDYIDFSTAVYERFLDKLLTMCCTTTINKPNSSGKRPLHLAVQHRNEKFRGILVSCLIKHGAHIDAVDKDGHTALDYCSKDSEIHSLLAVFVPPPLLCCAARTILSKNCPYHKFDLPDHILKIIELHNKDVF